MTASKKTEVFGADIAVIITAMTDYEKRFLAEALKSVLSDDGVGQVILCVDENNTWVDREIGSLATNSLLEIVRMPIAPVGKIRNKALRRVRKTFTAYCDGDDVWCNGKTLIQRAFFKNSDCEFVGCDHYIINEKSSICAFGLGHYISMPSSWMAYTKILRQYPFDESMAYGSDGEWWIRTANKIKKVRCSKTLIYYRVRPDSLSSNTPSKVKKTKVVSLARIPILRLTILFLSWCGWYLTRKNEYAWKSHWAKTV
jgi:hypothetical protein